MQTQVPITEAEGIEPPRLLHPADFKSVSSSIRATSNLKRRGFEPLFGLLYSSNGIDWFHPPISKEANVSPATPSGAASTTWPSPHICEEVDSNHRPKPYQSFAANQLSYPRMFPDFRPVAQRASLFNIYMLFQHIISI